MVWLYSSFILTDQRKYEEAFQYLRQSAGQLHELKQTLPTASFLQLVLQEALILYQNKRWREALSALRPVRGLGKAIRHQATYPLIRLFIVMIRFDLKDYEFLSYEIRSFERELGQLSGAHKSELLVLKTIKKLINTANDKNASVLVSKNLEGLNKLWKNPNEQIRAKTIDLDGWLNKLI